MRHPWTQGGDPENEMSMTIIGYDVHEGCNYVRNENRSTGHKQVSQEMFKVQNDLIHGFQNTST